jgi:hypothetical protein
VGGQHRVKLSRHDGVSATTQHVKRWTSVPTAAEDVGKDNHPTRGKHSGDLFDPSGLIRPVPQGQGGENKVEHAVGEGQALGSGMDVTDRQLGGSRREGGRHHPPRQIDTDQLGGRVAGSCAAQELSGATADIKDPPRLGSSCRASRRVVCWTGMNRYCCSVLSS